MTNPTATTVDRESEELRFRAALISSTAIHAGILAAAIILPLIMPRPVLMPDITPVRLVQLPAAAPEPVETPAPQPQPEEVPPEPEPEPIPAVISEPEPVPRSIEQLREEQIEEQRAAEEEERRRREEEEARRRREEEERRRREEEEARRAPQKAARKATPQSQTARRTAIDLTGTEEDQSRFTVEDFPFAAYLLRVRDMVAERWAPPPRAAYALARRAEIFFRIDRNGRLVVQPRALTASGDTLFDQAAMRAIAVAAPFPPLPREYEGQTLGVRFAFVQE